MFSDTRNIREDLQYYARHELVTKTSRFRNILVSTIKFIGFKP